MRLHQGDARAILPTLPAQSVAAVATDPPYELGFMGRGWDRSGIANDVALWRAVLRVLKPGGHLLAFGGTRTAHRMVCAIEDAGFEIRDTLCWLYGQGFPKSHNLDGDWQGWGTALKPAYEPVVLARAPLFEPTVAANVARWGTGALNIDAARLRPGELIRGGGNGQASNGGRYGSHEYAGQRPVVEPHTAGRWPPNCTLSHSPECRIITVGQRPTWDDAIWAPDANLCASCAAHAGKSRKPAARATKVSTVTSNAALTTNGKAAHSHTDTCKAAIGCSDGMRTANGAGSSSIGAFGKMPTDRYRQATLFTIETKSEPITDLRICNSCGVAITSTITKATGFQPQSIPAAGRNGIPSTKPSTPSANGNGEHANGQSEAWACAAGCPVALLDAQAGERKSGNGQAGARRIERANWRVGEGGHYGDTGSVSRFFYVAKSSAAERSRGLPNGKRNGHPTVKPLALMKWLLTLITPPGGVVLDPFAGSGSTLVAAAELGIEAIGIEQDAAYCATARQRLDGIA